VELRSSTGKMTELLQMKIRNYVSKVTVNVRTSELLNGIIVMATILPLIIPPTLGQMLLIIKLTMLGHPIVSLGAGLKK